MAYEIIYKKRYINKLIKLLDYLNEEWGIVNADSFIEKSKTRIERLTQQPYIGSPSAIVKNIRSILITKQNRVYYKISGNKIIVINMYDTRINPEKNIYKKNK